MEERGRTIRVKSNGVYRTRRQSVVARPADFGKKIDSGSAR
jgi:hypothetical protein